MVERQEAVFEFFVTHQQFPESVEPTMAGLYHPAAGLLLGVSPFLCRFALAADHMRDIAMCQDHGHGAFAAIGCIGAQVLGATQPGCRAFDHDGIEHGLNLLHVVRVRSGHDEGQRDSTPVHQQMALAAIFSPDPLDWLQRQLAPAAP